jgi:hypothetical protein
MGLSGWLSVDHDGLSLFVEDGKILADFSDAAACGAGVGLLEVDPHPLEHALVVGLSELAEVSIEAEEGDEVPLVVGVHLRRASVVLTRI